MIETSVEGTTGTIPNVEKSYTDPVTGKFIKGNPGGGRPPGSISIITRLKQIFEESPEEFEQFIKDYKTNPLNQRHIVEMIDGKPKGSETNVAIQINQNKIVFDDFGDETESK
jgi:hypothetical protein